MIDIGDQSPGGYVGGYLVAPGVHMPTERAQHGGEAEAYHLARLHRGCLLGYGVKIVIGIYIDAHRGVECAQGPREEPCAHADQKEQKSYQ